MPNVSTVTEMTDLISEQQSYQSDVTAMQTAKSMFTSTSGSSNDHPSDRRAAGSAVARAARRQQL